jgi:hypothetical protein
MSYSQLTGITSLALDALQVSEISNVDSISCGAIGTILMSAVVAAATLTSSLITVDALNATAGVFANLSASSAELQVIQSASLTSSYANFNAGAASAMTVGFATIGSLSVGTYLNFPTGGGTGNGVWDGSEISVGGIDTLYSTNIHATGTINSLVLSVDDVDASTVSATTFLLDGVRLGTTLDWSDITGKPSQIVALAEGAAVDVATNAVMSVASSAGNSLLSAYGSTAGEAVGAAGNALGDFVSMLGGSSDSGNGVTVSDANGMVGNQGNFQRFTSGTFDANGLVTAAQGIVSDGPVSVQGLVTAAQGLLSQGAAVIDGLLTASSGLSVAGSTIIEGPLLLTSQASASGGLAWAAYL